MKFILEVEGYDSALGFKALSISVLVRLYTDLYQVINWRIFANFQTQSCC